MGTARRGDKPSASESANADVAAVARAARHVHGAHDYAGLVERTGLFGMDLYSMHASMALVLGYLETVDPFAAKRARERYSCFDAYGDDPQHYGMATTVGRGESCEEEVVAQMAELRRHYGNLV